MTESEVEEKRQQQTDKGGDGEHRNLPDVSICGESVFYHAHLAILSYRAVPSG